MSKKFTSAKKAQNGHQLTGDSLNSPIKVKAFL